MQQRKNASANCRDKKHNGEGTMLKNMSATRSTLQSQKESSGVCLKETKANLRRTWLDEGNICVVHRD